MRTGMRAEGGGRRDAVAARYAAEGDFIPHPSSLIPHKAK